MGSLIRLLLSLIMFNQDQVDLLFLLKINFLVLALQKASLSRKVRPETARRDYLAQRRMIGQRVVYPLRPTIVSFRISGLDHI